LPAMLSSRRLLRPSSNPHPRRQLDAYIIGGLVSLLFLEALQRGVALDGVQTSPLFRIAGSLIFLVGLTKHGLYTIVPDRDGRTRAVHIGPPLQAGHSYLGLNEERSFSLFSELLRSGVQGYCITAIPPEEVRAKYGLMDVPMRWLARSEKRNAIDPGDLLGMSASIAKFSERAGKSVVLLEGLDYLVSVNGFRPTMSFLDRMCKMNAQRGGFIIAVSSGIVGSDKGPLALWDVFEEAPLVRARLKADKTVEVGQAFPLQLDLFNVGKIPVHVDTIENIISAKFEVVDALDYEVDGSSLVLGGKTVEPFQLESTILLLRAMDPGEEVLRPKIAYHDGKAIRSSQGVEPLTIRILERQDIEFGSERARSIFLYLTKTFSQDYLTKRYAADQSGWRGIYEIARGTALSPRALYGRSRKYGQPLFELLSRGLIEERIFTEHRGRGGESSKLRIAYDMDTVRRYVDRTVLGMDEGRKAPKITRNKSGNPDFG
jgi:Protein of unknown function (DUF835)